MKKQYTAPALTVTTINPVMLECSLSDKPVNGADALSYEDEWIELDDDNDRW